MRPGSPAMMDADALLRLAALHAEEEEEEETSWRRRAVSFARRFARASWKRKRNKGSTGALQTEATQAHIAWLNREVASTSDIQLEPERTVARRKGTGEGPGRWRQRTAEECLRIGFSAPQESIKHLARSLKPAGGHTHMKNNIHLRGPFAREATTGHPCSSGAMPVQRRVPVGV